MAWAAVPDLDVRFTRCVTSGSGSNKILSPRQQLLRAHTYRCVVESARCTSRPRRAALPAPPTALKIDRAAHFDAAWQQQVLLQALSTGIACLFSCCCIMPGILLTTVCMLYVLSFLHRWPFRSAPHRGLSFSEIQIELTLKMLIVLRHHAR